MINRTLVRTKVILTLFAFYQSEGKTKFTAEKELLKSFSDTYNLYYLLLDLVSEVTRFADDRQQENVEKAQAMHTEYEVNRKFIDNRFAAQLFSNRRLRQHLEEQGLQWDAAHDTVANIYKQIAESELYKEYMSATESSYDADKTLWRKIFANIFSDNSELEIGLDELEVTLDGNNWTTDMNVVLSYIVKTIKRFREDNGADQPLLEMFDSEEELDFAKRLLRLTIENSDEYEKLIAENLKNWEADRVAYMDMIIMKCALAEIINFPEIAVQVSMNEYIEIAREYSTENSPQFINGMLDQMIRQLGKTNKLLKAAALH